METLPPVLAQAIDPDGSQTERTDLLRVRSLFALGYAICMMLTLVLFGVYAILHWQAQQRSLNTRLASNAQLLASATQGRLGQYTVLADALAASLRRNPRLLANPAKLEHRLMQARTGMAGTAILRVVDAQGVILGATAALGPAFELRNTPQIWAGLLQARSLGRPVVGPLVRVPALGMWVLPQVHFYPAKGQTPAFWIGVGIDREAFNRFWGGLMSRQMGSNRLRQSEAFILVRQDGYVLARWPDVPAAQFTAYYTRPQTGILVRSLQANEGLSGTAFHGVVHSINQERRGYWARLGPGAPDLAVSVSLPASVLWSDYWRTLAPTAAAALLILATLTLAYVLLQQRMRTEAQAINARHEALLSYNGQLRQLADKDYLTALPNRRYLMAQLGRLCDAGAREEALRFAVAILDLDDFKRVNDTRGHTEGDKFLKVLSRRLQQALREGDVIVRLGGDEFAILLQGLTQGCDAMQACQRLVDCARTRVELNPQDAVQVTASLGLALYPEDGTEPEALLRHADQAMYAAKLGGKNLVQRFAPRMEEAAHAQQSAFDLLRQALTEHWLCLHYQPVVGISGREVGRVIGVEALLRIRHPEQGVLAAQSFISALDAPHLARPVGRWVLQQALGQAQFWNAQGLELRVMVNISTLHFLDSAWLDDLREALAGHPGVRPGQIEIELTESGALRDLDLAAEVMRASVAAGVRVALDDFGQGETTLRYLQRLPTHAIKIDQAFVRDMIDDPRDYAIVAGLLHITTLMGLFTVAEGVEDLDTLNLLASLGCSYAQGYGIARPMPAEELPAWIQAWRPPILPRLSVHASPNLPEIQRQRFTRLYAAAEGSIPFPQRVMEADAERFCHLGQWLHGAGQFFYGNDPRYADFHRRHAQIHALARRAKVAADAGDHAEALSLVRQAQVINDALVDEVERIVRGEPSIAGGLSPQ
ncbi:EAL domain-containing protein [Thiomonas sp.]